MNDAIARRYADALYEVAVRANRLDAVHTGLEHAVKIVGTFEVSRRLTHPAVTAAERSELISDVCTGIDQFVVNTIRLMVEHRRLEEIARLPHWMSVRMDIASGVIRAAVTVPQALDADETSKLEAALAARFGHEVLTTLSVDTTLIGGLILKVGDHIIDNSVRTKLQLLQQQLTTAN